METINYINEKFNNIKLREAFNEYLKINTNVDSLKSFNSILNKLYSQKQDLTEEELLEIVSIAIDRKMYSLAYVFNNLNKFRKTNTATTPTPPAQRTETPLAVRDWKEKGLPVIYYYDLCKLLNKEALSKEDTRQYAIEHGYLMSDGNPDFGFIYF